MAVIKDIIRDAKTGNLTSAEKVIIALLSLLLIIAFIFFGVIFKKVDIDKDTRFRNAINRMDSLVAEKDKLIFALRVSNDDKQIIIEQGLQRDSILQRIVVTNTYLLTKLNEKDAQISRRINSPSFGKDSLRKLILSGY